MPTPFQVIPWENDFLDALLRIVLEETNGNAGDALIVFPHSRPHRYLVDRFRHAPDLPRPMLMPRMYAVSDLFNDLRAELEDSPPKPIELLDRVGLLLECVRELEAAKAWENSASGVDHDPLAALPLDDTKRFFPWGVRLAQLLEDCFNKNIVPEDYHYMEGQVVDFAAALLARLSRIHEAYTGKLEERGWTTNGYDAFRSLRLLEGKQPALLRNKKIFIAGFYGLTGVEEALFARLWKEYDATILLHSDSELASPFFNTHDESASQTRAHWACREHERWLRDWKADAYLSEEPEEREQTIDFHEGFDLHSQLDVLEQVMSRQENELGLGDTAVILPDTAMLMPVLHHLPKKDINISMGYPLGRSTLFRLLETIMKLQETKTARGYHWKEVISLLRHPYLKMLSLNGERHLQVALHAVEGKVRSGSAWADPRTIIPDESVLPEGYSIAATDMHRTAPPQATGQSTPSNASRHEGHHNGPTTADMVLEQLAAALDLTLTRWETVTTPAHMADALADLCALLIQYGGDLWERFPIDAESLYRLMQRVIPALRECSLAHEEFPSGVLYTILRETIRGERVPFEADPLTGLQVLGMLESRLLRFSTIHVLDATEDKLPGAPSHDPLLPDTLRSLIGLPDSRHRERVAAYNFHRLIKGADNVTISYQAGVERAGLFEEKKQRSRFVEEMLWEEEKRQKKLLQPGDAPLHSISYPAAPISKQTRSIRRTPAIAERVNRYMQRPLSPSALDAYLTCPLRFFHERICGLGQIDEVNEGDDFAGMGELFHSVLEDFFARYKDQQVAFGKMEPDALQTLFMTKLHESELKHAIPFDSFVMLETAGKERLARFLANQPETTVIGLEDKLKAGVASWQSPLAPSHTEASHAASSAPSASSAQVNSSPATQPIPVTRHLQGRMDRMDQRTNGVMILDYKTGGVKEPVKNIWEDEELWQRIADWQGPAQYNAGNNNSYIEDSAESAEDTQLLPLLAEKLRSVQLPAYLYICSRADHKDLSVAAASDIAEHRMDAGWVELREHGKEKHLLGPKMDDDMRETIISEYIPTLIEFLFRHIETAAEFRPHSGKHCEWCSCVNFCSV